MKLTDSRGTTEWRLLGPAHDGAAAGHGGVELVSAELVAEISEFRGRVLHANGRRPAFAALAGQGYADLSPYDIYSWHVTVRRDFELIACVRVTPYSESNLGMIGELFDQDALGSIIRDMNLTPSDCVEGSRWIVAPCARGTAIGRQLLVSLWAVGRWLRRKCLFGAVGTRDGQDKMILRAGGKRTPGTTPFAVEEYNDELSLMYFDLGDPPRAVATALPAVESLLGIGPKSPINYLGSASVEVHSTLAAADRSL